MAERSIKSMLAETASRSRKILRRRDWIYLLSLLAPLAVYNIALKVLRISTQVDLPGPIGFLDQIRSDILFNAGFVALWVGLFAVVRSGVLRTVLLVLFHFSCILMLILTTSSHFYFQTTGSPLDYTMISLTFSSFGEIQGVIASEMNSFHWLLISVVLFYGIAGPAIVTRLARGDWHLPAWTRSPVSGYGGAVAVCLVSGLFVLLSALPSVTGASNNFSRDAIVNLFMTELASASSTSIDEEQIAASVSLEDLPTDTRLVETGETEKRNVVFVFLESSRASATTPYNPELDTTPFMDDLANRSLFAENAYAVVPHTSKSMVSAHCGIEPPLDTNMTESEPDAIPARCLPELLGEQGYESVFFQSATQEFERRPDLIENFGYDDFYPLEALPRDGYEEVNYFGYEDDIMLEPSRAWLEEHRDRPFMASYLTITGHHDYNVPSDFPTEDYVEDELTNKYMNAVAYQDQFLENLFQQYKDMGLYDETVFVVMSDHGEGFGEHELFQHDNTIYNEGIKIPMLFHDPRRFQEGENIEEPVQNMSVLQTTADLLGFDIENDDYHGQSLAGPIEEEPIKVSCWTENRCMSLIDGDDKYIYHFANRSEETFDLAEDPLELEDNIDEKDDEQIREKRYQLLEWQAWVRAIYDQHNN
jgi:lipoteichoic acid synthase